jgi:NAD(P)-dependent dehydrogenase (short-subunit alcohol dehydrogenase family)
MDLRDTVAVVTGGARGIGRGIAMALAREGTRVAVVDPYTPDQTTAGYALSTEQEVVKGEDLEERRNHHRHELSRSNRL